MDVEYMRINVFNLNNLQKSRYIKGIVSQKHVEEGENHVNTKLIQCATYNTNYITLTNQRFTNLQSSL